MSERDFKGVWIPKEIWLNTELTLLEKIIFVEIDSLDNESHCTAGNEYFAQFCDCSESKISKAIKKLQEMNMIEILDFDGRHRKIRVVKSAKQGSKKYEAESQKMLSSNKDSNKTINKNLKEKDSDFSFGKVFDSEVKKIKDSESVDRFVSLYNEHCFNLPKVVKLTDKRRKAINAVLKKYSTDEIIQAFDLANESDFLIGKNDRGWKADIDFILREDKFINILEGKYGGRKRANTSHASSDMGRTNAQYTAEQRKQFKEALRNGEAERI